MMMSTLRQINAQLLPNDSTKWRMRDAGVDIRPKDVAANKYFFLVSCYKLMGRAVTQLVEALRHRTGGYGFDSL